jgi:hypothetical protein
LLRETKNEGSQKWPEGKEKLFKKQTQTKKPIILPIGVFQ